MPRCLVHLASGVGNVVLATPLLVALDQLGFEIDVSLDADYPQTGDLLRPWSVVRHLHAGGVASALAGARYDAVIPAVPPFYWSRYARAYHQLPRVVARPSDALFAANEQDYYLAFARTLGYPAGERPWYRLPVGPADDESRLGLGTVVIAPGCKTGRMTAKRWPHYAALAERYDDVVLVGTADDLYRHDGSSMLYPPHVRSYVDRLTLRETAELMAAAGAVISNDSGLAHVAAAVGTPTVMLFGPTGDACLGTLPPNATVVRAGLPCEPCWRTAPLGACAGRIDCLQTLSIDVVDRALRKALGTTALSPVLGAGE